MAADVISALGNWITAIVLPWLVLETTGSAVKLGLVAGAELLPYLASGVFAAPLADRFGLRRTSIVTDLGSALAIAVIAAVPGIGYVALLALAAVVGGLRGVGDRAKHVLLAPMARQAGTPVVRMTSLYETLTRGTQMLGAPIGGLLIYWLGP
ncbi:MFS transporter, partial [Actinophytocola sp.]|uniref:MFS transporter n=1 Tax=Actinophytocola sp. TaxID=1872138 RepID=UPI002D7EC21F